ncbi:MAG: aromatic acid exporter family protein [Bacillus sp. (in: firmicutes)]
MKIGARILKTGIAIILAITLAQLLNIPAPAFAAIAAIFAIQPTIFRSYRTVIEQVQANIIGAGIAILFVMVFGNHAFLIGLACVITIIINLRLKTDTITLSVVTVIAIMENQSGNFLDFALLRFSSIMIGVLSSFVVNLLFMPPKYETKLYYKITSITEDIYKWIRVSTRHLSEPIHLKNEILHTKEQLINTEQLFLMYKEDRELFNKAKHAKARKLVVYRQMLATTRRSYEILIKLNKYENQYHQMPKDFQLAVREQLDYLITQHEQIHLKYLRKIKTDIMIENEHHYTHYELLTLFLSLQKQVEDENEPYLYHMMSLISAIIEYEEHIIHLETLINSFQSFHKDDEEIKPEINPET